MTEKEKALIKIKDLVERFSEQFDSYKNTAYNETLTRRDFIDPFFKALGWDIDNENGYAETYREVIHEDRVKIGKATKAPDYSFRLSGGKRLFFVEAKKPSVAIKEEILPAYQVRRYGWSAKLAVSIITDFEEFSVYDCTKKPKPTDKASVARIKYLTFREYISEFDYLWDTFSKEKVLKGSFDKYIQSDTLRKGTATVDKEFLQSLDNWRTYLATSISWNNKNLSVEEINFAVQHTLDRIIFLRIAEDRGVEPYGSLKQTISGTNYYNNILRQFELADEKYNSGLFDFHKDKVTKKIKIDNKTLKTICLDLYYPESPYEFSVFSVEILGSAYEQFLGKTITIDDQHRAKIELKPEIRKSGGVYYTPQYVVDYIVSNTIGKLINGKSPKDVSRVRIVDPSCGSGSFLIGAYQYLLDWHKNYYNSQNLISKGKKDSPIRPDGNLTTSEKKRILLNNIFGVDIDVNAVEVTKLSLLLKCMEGETEASIASQLRLFNDRVLPTLDDNIKDGNSLIDVDFYDGEFNFEDEKKVKPFSWKKAFPLIDESGGFDCVIGNPPYDVVEKDRLGELIPHRALQKYITFNDTYKSALGGKLNLYRFFIIKAIMLTKEKGRYGLIVPSSLLGDLSCLKTREHLLESSTNLEFDCFPQKDIPSKRIFEDAKLSTTIFFGEKVSIGKKASQHFSIRTYPGNSFQDKYKECVIAVKDLKQIDPAAPIPLIDSPNWKILRDIYKLPSVKRIGQMSNDIIVRRGEINQTIYREFIEENRKNNERLIKGVQIGQYMVKTKLSQGKEEWFNEQRFLKTNSPKSLANNKRIATQRITGVDEKLRIVASIISPKAYFADSTNSVNLNVKSKYDLVYLLALLNSKLFQWRFKLTSTNNNVGTNELEAMPFRTINFKDENDLKVYNDIIKIASQLSDLKETFLLETLQSNKERIGSKIEYYEDRINSMIESLYGLDNYAVSIINGK